MYDKPITSFQSRRDVLRYYVVFYELFQPFRFVSLHVNAEDEEGNCILIYHEPTTVHIPYKLLRHDLLKAGIVINNNYSNNLS